MEFSGQRGWRGAAIVSQRGDKDKPKLCYAYGCWRRNHSSPFRTEAGRYVAAPMRIYTPTLLPGRRFINRSFDGVRFTLESRHQRCTSACPLRARSGHRRSADRGHDKLRRKEEIASRFACLLDPEKDPVDLGVANLAAVAG